LFKNRAAKWVLGLLGAILVGAIGSGVWQGLLGPALRGAGIALLNLVALGFKSYKDSVYQQVAVDSPSRGAMELYFLLNFIVLFALGFVMGALSRMWRDSVRGSRRPPEDETSSSAKRMLVFSYVVFVIFGVVAVFCTINSAKVNYINSALLNYHQALRVVSPYLNEQERLTVESQFAQIRTRQDYVDILDKLDRVAQEHGQKAPQFQAW
jgi:hypothetical protein